MFYERESGRLEAFAALTAQTLDPAEVPFAAEVEKNVPVYDMAALFGRAVRSGGAARADGRMGLGAWAVFGRSRPQDGHMPTPAPIDAATRLFEQIIAREKASGRREGRPFRRRRRE